MLKALLLLLPVIGESCQCSTSTPYCYRKNGWCYRSSTSNTYNYQCKGTCTRSGSSSSSRRRSSGGSGGGWRCSKQSLSGQAREFTMWANVYKCMHDGKFIKWDSSMARKTKSYFGRMSSMSHSPSSARPNQGENLYWAYPAKSAYPAKAGKSWYSEYKYCKGRLPGCKVGGAGHFTAMIWHDANKIGCYKNSHGLSACRYKGGSGKCRQPNFEFSGYNCYKKNVRPRKRSKSTCMQKVKSCFGKSLPHSSYGRLYDDDIEEEQDAEQYSLVTAGVAAVALVSFLGFVFIGVSRFRKRRNYGPITSGLGEELDQEKFEHNAVE